jgi:hypothetical protein
MSYGCINMLLFLSFRLSRDGCSVSLNIWLCPFFGVLSKVFWIHFIALCMFFVVCFCIMLCASFLAFVPV